jgi:hypothetical protein
MTLFAERKSPRTLCEDMASFAQSTLEQKFARRAWNRFKPTVSPWWLVPSAKQPTYSFKKFYFSWENEKEFTTIQAGIHLSKGLDPALAVVYPSKKGKALLMDKHWGWNDFLSKAVSGTVKRRIREIKTNEPLTIIVKGGYVQDPSRYDPYLGENDIGEYKFSYDIATDSLKRIGIKRSKDLVLKSLNKATSFDVLIKLLEILTADQWMWLDLFILSDFSVSTDEQIGWKSEQIWENYLQYLW